MDAQASGGVVPPVEPDIDIATYDRSARILRHLKKLFKLTFALHGDTDLIEHGQIFLFNHFARFETCIPQYLFYEARQVYCCAVAAAEFFQEDTVLSVFLRDVGVMPNNHPRLLPWLAGQIFRGRKVVIFPEGGMVKDRRVLDRHGRYEIYSRSSMDKRKQHTGAAVLALGLDLCKNAIRQAAEQGDTARLASWGQALRLENREALVAAARQPTLLVPANITFYPLRIDDHILTCGVDLFGRDVNRRLAEELLIEGNLLLRATDMDIRFGRPIVPGRYWNSWETWLGTRVAERLRTPDQAFAMTRRPQLWDERLLATGMRRCAGRVRNDYMREMYRVVTVNLSHLASTLVMHCLAQGRYEIKQAIFHRTLYLALKRLQNLPDIALHRSLQDPDDYRSLLDAEPPGLSEFLGTARKSGLLELRPEGYRFLPKLLREYALDEIRIENPVAVYANEVEPLVAVTRAVKRALRVAESDLPLIAPDTGWVAP